MPSKQKKKRSSKTSDPTVVTRLLEKGDAREALKEAKRRYRLESSPLNRELLETAYLGRVKQLQRLKNLQDAKIVLAELLKLNPRVPEVLQEIPRIQVIVGDPAANTTALLDEDPLLLRQMIDESIVDPRAVVPRHGDIESQVVVVRQALALIEQGQDDVGLDLLRGIPRTSPLADWRLFARGLASFYQADRPLADKNWERLDQERPPFRIAATLREAADAGASRSDLSDGARKLLRHLGGDSLTSLLEELATAWHEGRKSKFAHLLRQLKLNHGTSHEKVTQQALEFAWKQCARKGDVWTLGELARENLTPRTDPKFNRAHALLIERDLRAGDCEKLRDHWDDYLKDLEKVPDFSEQERQLARGLICHRLASHLLKFAATVDDQDYLHPEEEELIANLRKDGVYYLRRGIDCAPDFTEPYRLLATHFVETDQESEAAKVYKKLLKRQPDHVEANIWLAKYYTEQKSFELAERYVASVARISPRDSAPSILRWNLKHAQVMELTIKRKFKEARAAIEEAAQSPPANLEPLRLSILRAGIELKAKDRAAAQPYIDQALALVDDPTPVWLQLSATATRMRAAREMKKEFEDLFQQGIKKKANSATAGIIARYLTALRSFQVKYSGSVTHERLFTRYLEKARKIDWRDEDLRAACRFLIEIPKRRYYPLDLIERGTDLFPETPHYFFWMGRNDVLAGPGSCDPQVTLADLEEALRLHERGPIKLEAADERTCREDLAMVQEFIEMSRGFPFTMLDGDDEEYDEEEYDEDYEDEALDFSQGSMMGDVASMIPPGISREEFFKTMIATMPPDLKKQLKEATQETGADPQVVLEMLLGTMLSRMKK